MGVIQMNKEYIEREACLKEFKELKPANWDNTEYEKQILANYNFYHSIVENAPAADVAPVVHGEWKYYTIGVSSYHECSICGENSPSGFRTPHCPWCGAKMKEN